MNEKRSPHALQRFRMEIIMATIVERAVKKQRKSMTHLYLANTQKVYFIAKNLLLDEKNAADTVIQVFQTIWNNIPPSGDTSEAGFTALVVQRTVELCKKKITGKEPKAFKLPTAKDLTLTADAFKDLTEAGTDSGTDPVTQALSAFSPLHRFLFVLYHGADYSKTMLARTFRFDLKLITQALDAQKEACSDLVPLFKEREATTILPEFLDQAVLDALGRIAAPGEAKQKKRATIASIVVLLVCLCGATVFLVQTLMEKRASRNGLLDSSLTYYADIEIQNYGTITIRLEEETAPISAANFVALAESGFYDGLTFHRIMEGFMMQGGDPKGNGTGGSEQKIVGEFSANGYDNPLSHTRGAVSMARSNDYNSASSQFFIMHKDKSSVLDGKYAVFAYVTEGMEIVDMICVTAQPTDDNGTIPAAMQPVIQSITIRTE